MCGVSIGTHGFVVSLGTWTWLLMRCKTRSAWLVCQKQHTPHTYTGQGQGNLIYIDIDHVRSWEMASSKTLGISHILTIWGFDFLLMCQGHDELHDDLYQIQHKRIAEKAPLTWPWVRILGADGDRTGTCKQLELATTIGKLSTKPSDHESFFIEMTQRPTLVYSPGLEGCVSEMCVFGCRSRPFWFSFSIGRYPKSDMVPYFIIWFV